jgi:hypothetical protein
MDRALAHVGRVAGMLNTTAALMCDAYMAGTLSPLRTETLVKIGLKYGVTVTDMFFALAGIED